MLHRRLFLYPNLENGCAADTWLAKISVLVFQLSSLETSNTLPWNRYQKVEHKLPCSGEQGLPLFFVNFRGWKPLRTPANGFYHRFHDKKWMYFLSTGSRLSFQINFCEGGRDLASKNYPKYSEGGDVYFYYYGYYGGGCVGRTLSTEGRILTLNTDGLTQFEIVLLLPRPVLPLGSI